MVEHL
jgi:hypothetical protein